MPPQPKKRPPLEEIQKRFHLPLMKAAEELGICQTLLKKFCRFYGITRWPYRKIKSMCMNPMIQEATGQDMNQQINQFITQQPVSPSPSNISSQTSSPVAFGEFSNGTASPLNEFSPSASVAALSRSRSRSLPPKTHVYEQFAAKYFGGPKKPQYFTNAPDFDQNNFTGFHQPSPQSPINLQNGNYQYQTSQHQSGNNSPTFSAHPPQIQQPPQRFSPQIQQFPQLNLFENQVIMPQQSSSSSQLPQSSELQPASPMSCDSEGKSPMMDPPVDENISNLGEQLAPEGEYPSPSSVTDNSEMHLENSNSDGKGLLPSIEEVLGRNFCLEHNISLHKHQ